MEYSDLWAPNPYGEVVADDIWALVDRIAELATQNGTSLALTPAALHGQLLQYILLRQKTLDGDIAMRWKRSPPRGWTIAMERIWRDWLAHTITLDVWRNRVLAPVFGTDIRGWEAGLDGWREDILYYLLYWFERSPQIVAAFDPTPLEEPTEEASKIDVYLLEHGTSRQKRNALRGR